MRRHAVRQAFAVWMTLACAIAGSAWAQQPAKPAEQELVAVMELDSLNADKPQLAALTEELRAQLLQTQRFRIIDRQQIDTLLQEQAFQQTGCTSQECTVQVGRILGVRKMVTGRVTRIDASLWQVSAQIIDVESAETLKSVTVNHSGDFAGLLTQAMASLAHRLTGDGVQGTDLGAGRTARAAGPLRLAVFPGFFNIPNANPENWYLIAIQKGIESARAKMAIDVPYSFYPAFIDGKPFPETAGLERGAWSLILEQPNESYVAERAQKLSADASLQVKVLNTGKNLVWVYVVDARTQKVYEERTESPNGQGTKAVVQAITNALLRYQTYGR